MTRLTRTRERDQLALLTSRLNRELDQRRETLSAEATRRLELQQALSEAADQQRELQTQIERAEAVTDETIEIETYATAISHTVDGDELHFQLKNGRITPIPFEKLINAVKDVWQNHLWKLKARDEVKETLGPIDGFRVRYTIVRGEASLEAQLAGARPGTYFQVDQWELIPISSTLGEEVELALQDDSELHTLLRAHHPRRTTITLWTYPESFSDYQKMKTHLHETGLRHGCTTAQCGPVHRRLAPRQQVLRPVIGLGGTRVVGIIAFGGVSFPPIMGPSPPHATWIAPSVGIAWTTDLLAARRGLFRWR